MTDGKSSSEKNHKTYLDFTIKKLNQSKKIPPEKKMYIES